MPRYILVYVIERYPDDGGGTYCEDFEDNEQKMHDRVSYLAKTNRNEFKVVHAGWLHHEFTYEPVTYATEFKPNRI